MDGHVDQERARKLAIYKRVDEAFNSKGIKTQRQRAKICGVTQVSISKWKRGINAPTTLNMLDISAATGYEVTWLFLGKGRKYSQPNDDISDKLNRLLQTLDPADREQILRVALAMQNEQPDED